MAPPEAEDLLDDLLTRRGTVDFQSNETRSDIVVVVFDALFEDKVDGRGNQPH